MEHLPVRSYAAGILLATLVTFTGTLSFKLSSFRPLSPAPAVAEAAVRKPQSAAKATPSISKATSPAATGKRYTVQQGDSLWEIASRYGLNMEVLLASNPQVDDPGHIKIGQEIILPPGATLTAVAATISPSPDLTNAFAWPVLAQISSPFGPRDKRNHNGIDLAAQMGDPIKAARDGEVILAGEVQGYGQTVILSHADGTLTLYGHCSRLLVKAGERVNQGEVIALVGSTGNSTGPHLHFEIIVNNKPNDPLLYLPKR